MENTSEIVAGLQELQNQVKYFHWQTKSYAQHQALGRVFEAITELIDTFVETLMGKYGRPSTKGQKFEMFDFDDIDIEEWTGGVCDLLISFSDVLDDVQDTDLLNLRDEMLGEFNQLKYLLTLNENMKKKKVIKLSESDLNYIIKRVMNENEDTSMDEYINWDIKSVDCEGSYLGNMSSMGVSEDKDGNPKVFIRYCKGDNEELNYLKRKARREIEQSNQLPSDNESLFENKNIKNKKVIKLSENDLYRIVKRVISEQPDKNIKHPSPDEISKGKKTGCYTVNSGDQLMKIAKAFGVTVDDIVQLNAFRSSGEEIYPGQKIKVQNTTKFIGC